ncbi:MULTISPECIES: type-F conjugative transfer system secretin TraK [unclassified Variovorax]|uniref:type-F conjugative transfer system secretin TraK n=1 Tax=unclassified Variovorax TaxID=663243 RepID=UPI00076DA99F|nr:MULTISPECIES: type-F conjugative transfer system secretin TraK [unclassified Variovorax]KWT98326.1 hypothetical protein APY03_0461 [Variovorax sp. WDL1]
MALALVAGLALSATAFAAPAKKQVEPVKGATIELPEPGVVTVSDYEFNTFVFSEPAKRFIFPAGSPVSGDPITLSGGTQVLLQFTRGADRPVQMVVELQSGKVEKLRVVPKAVPGITYPVNGARLKPPSAARTQGPLVSDGQKGSSPRGADIELLKTLTTGGEPPSGFEPVSLPRPTRFDKFTVVPMAGWSDGAKRILVFSLVAAQDQTAVVSPNQFYREGINAVLLDGDTVDANSSPQLFVVEELGDE